MVKREGSYDGYDYTLERYGSIDEFLRVLEERPTHGKYSDNSEIRMLQTETYRDSRHQGAKGYTDAKTQFIEGTKAKTELAKTFAATQTSRKRERVNSICGCAPIVAKAIMGQPDSMIDIRRKKEPKTVTVVVNMSINFGASGESITEAGKKIIKAVGELEAKGISTEIVCTADKILEGRQLSSCGITIKNAGQAFSAARVSFSMSSPAFLRVFQWLQLAKNPNAIYSEGFGSNVTYTFNKAKQEAYFRKMYGNGIYISLPDVERLGEYAINKAIEAWKTRR